MCFSSKTPTPTAPPPPPTEREAGMDAMRQRQQASLASSQSGFPSTDKLGGQNVGTNPTQTKLGA